MMEGELMMTSVTVLRSFTATFIFDAHTFYACGSLGVLFSPLKVETAAVHSPNFKQHTKMVLTWPPQS